MDISSPNLTQINNTQLHKLSFEVDDNIFCQRSDLIKEIVENCVVDKPIKLQLERPEKFGVLLKYLNTGELRQEFLSLGAAISYVNDAVYLKISELEEHFQNLLLNAINTSKCHTINFDFSQPSIDFMEKFLEDKVGQKQSALFSQQTFSLLVLLGRWAVKKQVHKPCFTKILTKFVNYDSLDGKQLQDFERQYTSEFNYIFPSYSFLLKLLSEQVRCKQCGRDVCRMCIGVEECFAQTGFGGNNYVRMGYHCL